MSELGPVIAFVGAVVGTYVGGPFGAAIVIGSALGGGALANTAATGVGDDSLDAGRQINTRSSRHPLPLPYGQCRLGVNKTFLHVQNPYLHIIAELGEGEINGIVREDGSVYTTTAGQLPTSNPPQVFLDDKIFTDYGGNVYLEFFNGSSTQAVCSTLQSATAKWDQTLRHTAYLYARLKWDADKFNSEPNITAEIQGLKLYNPVDGTTVYSNNAALCAYDFMTRSAQRGGIGLGTARLSTPALSTAIDYCTAKGWTCNMPISENQSVSDNLAQILNNFRGDVIQSGDVFKIKFRDTNYEPVVMSLGESDVIRGGDGFSSLQIVQPDIAQRPNAIRAVHLSAEKKYKADDIITSDATAIAAEGDLRERRMELYGLSEPELVQKMSNYYLERMRLNKSVAFTAGSRAMALEPMDLVYLDHTMPGWDDNLLRVLRCDINGDHTVSLSLIEEASTFYDDTYNLTAHDYDDTDLPGPLDAVPSVINVTQAEEVYYYRNRSFTRWVIDFDAPAAATYPWWDYAEIWLKIADGEWRYMTRCDTNYMVDPVEEGETYYLKVRSVSVFGGKEDFDNCTNLSKTIVGVTAAPSSLSALTAIANGDSVSIYATPLSDPDIEGYEIRLGDSWDGGIFVSFNKSMSLRLNGVRPGTHTFWAAAKDNAGNYSATPVSTNVTVFVPPGFSELATYGSWAWDFTSGTHNNTEHDTYDSEDALKCSHTGDVLTGDWTSPTQDLNAIVKVRVWGDMRADFVSSATTWAGVYPGSTTWADIDSGGTKIWQEIFQPLTAAQLLVTLRHKQGSGDAWSEVDFFELLCAEVEARYISVVVTIIDPTLDANLYLKELNMLAYEGPQ